MSYYDKHRLVVAKLYDEDTPFIIGGISESTWEILPPEDWDAWKREMGEKYFGPDWTSYDYIEVIMEYPVEKLMDLFKAQHIKPVAITRAES